jgi:hypothetical protein
VINEITYLIAPAWNSIEVPLLAFPTPEQAHAFCMNLGLRGARKADTGEGEWEPVLDGSPVTFYSYAFHDGEYVSLAWALERELEVSEKNDPERQPLMHALFRSGYYDSGNGEAYTLRVQTLPVGAPVVPWDFD